MSTGVRYGPKMGIKNAAYRSFHKTYQKTSERPSDTAKNSFTENEMIKAWSTAYTFTLTSN